MTKKIITKLLTHTLGIKRIENVLLVTEPDEYDLFLKLLDREHIQDNSFLYGIYGYLMEEGIIYSFYDEGRFFLAVPGEIKEAYRIFGNMHFDETLKRHQLVYKYISALNNLYGVFKMEKLIEIFNCQNDKQLTSKEFLTILDKSLLRQQSFY